MSNMKLVKTITPPMLPPHEEAAETVYRLRQQRADTLARIIELEKAGATPKAAPRAEHDLDALERQLLGNSHGEHSQAKKANHELFDLRLRLQTFDRLILRAEETVAVAHRDRSRGLVAAAAKDWAELQRQRAALIAGLHKVNRQIEDLKKSCRSGGQYAGMPCDGFTPRLFGIGGPQDATNHWAYAFLKQATLAGYVRAEDVADVMSRAAERVL